MNIKLKHIAACLFASLAVQAQAQTFEVKETSGASFLETLTDARSAGMGGVSSVSEGGALGVFNNASANLFTPAKFGVGANLSARESFSDGNLYSLGGFYNIDENNSFSLGFRYFKNPKVDILNLEDVTETFKPKEFAIDLGYGRKLTEHLALSVTLRYIYSDMGDYMYADKGHAFAADLGLTYANSLSCMAGGKWSVGLAASNFGSRLKYDEEKYKLPAAVKLGGSIHLPFSEDHKLTGTVNMGYRVMPSDYTAFEAGIGAEYNLYQYGFLRAGYHVGDKDKGLGNFATMGAGVELKPVRVDFSYWAGVSDSKLKNIMFITLSAMF